MNGRIIVLTPGRTQVEMGCFRATPNPRTARAQDEDRSTVGTGETRDVDCFEKYTEC
jgi:hypothetical protein